MPLTLIRPFQARKLHYTTKYLLPIQLQACNRPKRCARRSYAQTPDGLVQESLKRYTRWYPEDTVTGANIDTYLALRRNVSRSNDVLVGIIYANEHARGSSKVLEALLADPLSAHSESWYRQIETRAKTENNIFAYSEHEGSRILPEAFSRASNFLKIASPVLDAETRPKYREALPNSESECNFLEIVEVNKNDDIEKVADVCSFYIYVTPDLSVSSSLPRHVQSKILLTIVDNQEYTPRSIETTPVSFLGDGVSSHVIKIDSNVLAKGIDLLYEHDTKAASQFFESIQASNILELSKLLSWYVRTENLRDWTLSLIKTEIASNNLSEHQIREIYNDLKLNQLVKGSQQMHAEFQTEFVPETKAFFHKRLRWYMLYFKNDNVEYAVKDYFSSHFMNKSIDSYNYLKGQLVARLQAQKFASYTEKDQVELNNPLQDYKADLINNRVPREIQSVVYSSIVSAFAYYQLPLSALSLVGYVWVGLDAQTAIAIAALGWMLGFNHVSKTWHNFSESWLNQLFEEVRLVISKECMEEGLWKELNSRFEGATELAQVKQQVLKDLEIASGHTEEQGRVNPKSNHSN
ncbi:hypothetical protein OXX79_005424 [Metschnikowia pulcherrima]